MSVEKTGTLIIGGGQAGIAMSEHLAERWRTERWDSLVANGPAWHDRFPNLEFTDVDADGFASKDSVVNYFERYADMINAPIRCGVSVESVQKISGTTRFAVDTSHGQFEAENIVAATGPFQKPIIPPIIPESEAVRQLHSNEYHNPAQLADGAVLVVGAGSSGTQIADELMRADKKVYLSVGPHQRPPRSYRGRDFCWWLGVLGQWDNTRMEPGKEHVTIAVSGSHGGFTIDFRQLAERGMTLVGLTESYENGTLQFAADIASNIAEGDESYLSLLQKADEFVESNGLDLPLEPQAHQITTDPECIANPIQALNLKEAGITSVIWATGEPGVYFLGLPWQSRRGSAFIWGVWHDAKYLADQIVKQKTYFDYHQANVEKTNMK